ncbi:hypothetical protein EW145_g3562 [Phellinidium pouzarii]|uniref:Uncharacterized protein n=1 Tax=Phellinidium pouzarii TaxID=167371 RepID=A0A4S4L6N9_9AGAM|nr:hypothetical protein EW145_g3562 [Phellinidium pouzarii]
MSSLTHINPFVQGGWDSEGPWPNDGSNSPATSSHSSGSTRGNDAVSQWFPAQSSYGVLPLAATPGVLPPGLLGAPVTFRFMACGNQTNIAVVGPGTRTIYRMKTNSTHTYVSIQTGIVAIINWAGTEPILELGGRSYRTSEYLRDSRDAQHTR